MNRRKVYFPHVYLFFWMRPGCPKARIKLQAEKGGKVRAGAYMGILATEGCPSDGDTPPASKVEWYGLGG